MKRKISISAVAVIIAAVIAVCLVFYTQQVNQLVTENNMRNMEELARHDVQSIQNSLTVTLERLQFIGQRLGSQDISTLEDIQDSLYLESTGNMFDVLYLLDEDGRLYSSQYAVTTPDKHDFEDLLSEGEAYSITKYEAQASHVETLQDSLLFAMRLNDLEVEGIRFTAIFGQCNNNYIQNQMRIDSFDGQGYSSVIDTQGHYVVNINRTESGEQDYFYDQLAAGTITQGESAEAVEQKVLNREEFSVVYTDSHGQEKVLNLMPIDMCDWTLVTVISKDLLDAQSQQFTTITTILLTIIATAMVVLLFMLYYSIRATVEAKAKARARSEFLSTMSHEIRTPLNGIIGLNHLMSRNLDDREKMRGYISKMGSTTQYLLALVNDILDLSKLQAGKVDLEERSFCVTITLDNLWSMLRTNIEEKQLRFTMTRDLPYPYIVGDEMRVKQILMNILSNAVKFTPAGGEVDLTVTQSLENNVVTTSFRVTDTGCGMSKEFVSHVFEAFAQERGRISDSQKGTGLGMAISHLLVQAMGGQLTAESELGKGSCFTFVLPARLSDKALTEAAATEPAVLEPAEPDHPLQILLAEDNDLNAEILIEILADRGFTVTHAVDGHDTVETFAAAPEHTFDVILMDMQMPVMDGCQATKAIRAMKRADAKTVKIFACSANTMYEDQLRAREAGMNDFLPKPIDVAMMLKKLGNVT